MRINIVGWKGINHSYSIIAETYIRGLILNPNIELYFTEFEYYNKQWAKSRESLFDKVPAPKEDDTFDMTVRFIYPYNLIPDAKSKFTVVFMTCEFNYVSEVMDTYDVCDNVWIMTPSEYSKRGIIRTGFSPEKIFVIPHCYDYIDCPLTKQQLREKYKIPKNDYVFYHNSSITANKNVYTMIECFEMVYKTDNDVTLLVKGLDKTYGSRDKLNEIVNIIGLTSKITCVNKIKYIGDDVSESVLVELYELSDCYLSPFHAEGFNLPVLEAMCHGKHVICTKGGPPDEFAKDAHFIESTVKNAGEKVNIKGKDENKTYLEPSPKGILDMMLLIPLIKNTIDKKKYREKYSSRAIGKMMYEKINYILQQPFILPKIILLDSKTIDMTIKNIRRFSGDVTIYVGVYNDVQYIKDSKNIALIELGCPSISDSRRMTRKMCDENFSVNLCLNDAILYDSKIKCVVDIIRKNHIGDAIYISDSVILLADPRAIYNNERGDTNKYFYDGDYTGYACICINTEKQTLFPRKLLTVSSFKEKKHSFSMKRGRTKILYTQEENDDAHPNKVFMLINDTHISPEEIYIEPEDKTMTPEKLLEEVNVSVITQSIIKKYSRIMRKAPLTVLFNEREKIIGKESCASLCVGKIFVFPEALPYFFDTIYQHISNKFTLYTLTCDLIVNGTYKSYDKQNKIIACKYI